MIHSPLVGPATLRPLGRVLGTRGFDVTIPDLRSALTAQPPAWRAVVDAARAAADAVESVDVVVAHSGAGTLMPMLARELDPRIVVFVDAVLPGDGTHHRPGAGFVEFIDSLPNDGPLLPPWHEWWGEAMMAELIPDKVLRRAIAADTPRVPRSFFTESVPLPAGWSARAGQCYLQLSPAYADDRARAAAAGWPHAGLDGQHLDVAAKPTEVAVALIDLIVRTG